VGMFVRERSIPVKCARSGCPHFAKQPTTGRPGKYCSDRCANYVRKQAQRKRERVSVTELVVSRKQPDIQFYCGLNEKYWNYHPVEPGEYACIAPFTSTNVKDKETGEVIKRVLCKTQVHIDDSKVKHILLDSSAFSDGIELDKEGSIVANKRLSFNHALQRQIAHAYEFRYAHLVDALVSYDLLIDEVWKDGVRSKDRWSVESAEFAVGETIKAAEYLSSQRRRIEKAFGHPVNLVLSAQGVEATQYKRCAQAIVKFMKPDDVFGLGGWCITGLRRYDMLPAAAVILPGVFEVLGNASVKRVHVFGVILPALLGFLLSLCDLYGMQLSTDSSGPCREPAEHGRWGYGSWTNPTYKKRSPQTLESCKAVDEQDNKAPSCPPGTHCRGLERARHVALTRDYLANFREREPRLVGPLPVPKGHQLALMEVAS
jgi:hypothetical protein